MDWREGNGICQIDKELLQCLDAVDRLLLLRESLTETLRKGWLELACARYGSGPARISHQLFSLQPLPATAKISILSQPSDVQDTPADLPRDECDKAAAVSTPLQFSLLGNTGRGELKVDLPVHKEPSSVLRRRAGFSIADIGDQGSKEENGVGIKSAQFFYSDSDYDDEDSPQRKISAPLHWFGAFVTPQLRSAQGSFQSALPAIVDLVNAQSEAIHAHNKVSSLKL